VRKQKYPKKRLTVWLNDDASDVQGAEETFKNICDIGFGNDSIFGFYPRTDYATNEKDDAVHASELIRNSGLQERTARSLTWSILRQLTDTPP
jgi:hypothetical protein